VLRDFFLGFVRIHILHHAALEPIYGVAIMEELRRHGYDLSPGTLYPLLHTLEAAGYLQHQATTVGGKVRKYYRITPAGEQALAEAKVKIRELVDEVLEGRGPTRLPEPPATDENSTEET
jgi:PadR family transcriptional regulator, regulatory protein PadR